MRRVRRVLICRELIPQLLFPRQLFRGIHQPGIPLRLQAESEMSRIIHSHFSRCPLFRRYNNDTSRSPGTVNSGSGSIFQERDILDIIRVNTRYSIHENLVKVFRLHLIQRDFRQLVLHGYPVNYPQGFRVTGNRVGSPNPNFS